MAVVVVGLIAVSSWAGSPATGTWLPVVKFSGAITDYNGLVTPVTVPTNGLEVWFAEEDTTGEAAVGLVEISGTTTNELMLGAASVVHKTHTLVGMTDGAFTPTGWTTNFECMLEWVGKEGGSKSNGSPTTLNVKLSGLGTTNDTVYSAFTGTLLAKTPKSR
jgi:hypothetical protein